MVMRGPCYWRVCRPGWCGLPPDAGMGNGIPYGASDAVMAVAAEGAMVQHCLPAHREEEITAKVFEEHAEEIFAEAENRLHAQKAVLVKLMSDK